MWKKILIGALVLLLIGLAIGMRILSPGLGTITGMTAKQMCSLNFVSGLDEDRAFALYLEPLFDPYLPLVRWAVDESEGEARASILGLGWKARAVYREGLGCTVVRGRSGVFDASASLPSRVPEEMAVDLLARSAFDEEALDAAVGIAFETPGAETLAVVVMHRGRLVAERYADGITAQTPLHGWSMTKSAAATFAGVLAERDLLDVETEGTVPPLVEAGRGDITVDHLLRMTAGLEIDERNDGFDPNSEMLFRSPDMARFAATRAKVAEPGEVWDYMSGQTVLAGTSFQPIIGRSPEEQVTAIRDGLFEPLRMHTAIIEADATGNLVWSSYMYASAQDWAKLGQLYVDGGLSPDGVRLIPEDWYDYVRRTTGPSEGRYGAGFWLLGDWAGEDAMLMDGFQGQLTWVMPEHELVIVRLGADSGWTKAPRQMAAGVIAALQPSTVPAD